MKSNRKFILLEILVITFFVMSVVPVCGLSDSSADISAYPSIVNPGDEITVTYSGAPGFEFDWIAMYEVGETNVSKWCGWREFLAGKKSGTLTFTAPDEPGDYEFRLFEDDCYTYIARSNIVRVQDETTPTSEEAIILFEANFDDGYAQGFGNEVGDWEVHFLYPYTGMYTAMTGTFRFSMAGDTNWQDYVVEADFFNAQDGGLLVRAQDQDNCIVLIVRPATNEIGWNIRKGGSWGATGLEVATLGHELGEELHVKVEVAGSEFKAYVNGVLKTTLNSTEYLNGKIGLYLCKQSDQYWDNVVVYSSGAAGSIPSPTAEAGLVAYYTFDGDTLDHSGNGNDGTNHGATFVSGIRGQALSFDGMDDYVQVPDSPGLDIASNNISLSAWVCFPEFVPGYGTVIEKTGSGGWNRYGVFSENGKLSFLLYTESIEAHTAVSADQWVHFVATYDGISMKIYINGALDVEREEPGIDIKENNMSLMIGADPFGDGHYDHILIDEVKIYNCALSDDEIKALYEGKEPSGPTPKPSEISGKGDCNGDGIITSEDALCALQMAVGKRADDGVMDVNGDGKVSSLDARKILRVAAGLEEFP